MFASSEIKVERTPRYAGGPHNLGMHVLINFFSPTICLLQIYFLGDPDDIKLRKIEQNVVIPKIVRERAKYEKCSEENKSNFSVNFNTF